MTQLSNSKIVFALDGNGSLSSLKNLDSGYEYASGGAFFRIIYSEDISLEEELFSNECIFRITESSDERIVCEYEKQSLVRVKIECVINDDDLSFNAEIENLSLNGNIIREFQFPYLSGTRVTESTRLYRNSVSGEFFDNISKHLDSCGTAYIALDNEARESSVLYPGSCVMNMFVLENADLKSVLYFGCHDESFSNTLHLARKRKNGDVDFCFVKYPLLAPGKKISYGTFVLSPIDGTWHKAALKYRKWAEESWFTPHEKPSWFSSMNAWHRIIMRHQYGKVIFPYEAMDDILKSSLECGANTLFMFGWWREGMDAGYPDYTYDLSQGGFEALKKNIASFQSNGGHVILYFNGQLIDTDTDFYRERGHLLSCKLPGGTREHQEFYKFGGAGTALRAFGNKVFVTACPSSREWLEILKSFVDRAIDLGCHGVFFDQLGWTSYPCCAPSHGHDVPFMNVGAAKRAMLKELFEYSKSKAPQMAFGIEWLGDITAQYTDFIHNIAGMWERGFEEMYRYAFPEFSVSDRCIRDDSPSEWQLNEAFRLGLRSDIEIYRCRATIDDAPNYKARMTKINRLRSKYAKYLFDGTFHDTIGAELAGDNVRYSVYTSKDGGMLVVATADKDTKCTICVSGKSEISRDGIDVSFNDDGSVSMPENAVCTMEFR